ncbi:MAG: hypothetical protein ACRD3W_31500, partial [Terriglobales bacterium]
LEDWANSSMWNDNYAPYACALGGLAYRIAQQDKAGEELLNLAMKKMKTNFWPKALIQYELNQIDEDELYQRADDEVRLTEAKCFVAMQEKLAGDEKKSKELFTWIEANGNRTCFAYRWARYELLKR